MYFRQEGRITRRRRHRRTGEQRQNIHSPSEAILAEECKILTSLLEGNDASQMIAANSIRGRVLAFSLDESGCRVVQLALEKKRSIADKVCAELQGRVVEAGFSPHGNFVIQKMIEVLPIAQFAFVVNEVLEKASDVARHRYSCRIIVRILEHASLEATTLPLLEKLLTDAPELCRHQFGKFVVSAMLEHCSHRSDYCHRVAIALRGRDNCSQNLLTNAMNRHASRVIESALIYCDSQDKLALCEELLSDDRALLQMAKSQFGLFVLKAMLRELGDNFTKDAVVAKLDSLNLNISISD